MSAGPFKIATVLFLAALPLGLFGALDRGEARVANPAAAPATQQAEVIGGDRATLSDSSESAAAECQQGSEGSCDVTVPDPTSAYREVWAEVAAFDFGDTL